MYCADFTAVYDKTTNKLFFARQKHDLYQNGRIYQHVYVKKFYMHNDNIYFKYLRFGQTTENKGIYEQLFNYVKRKTYKLTNFKSIREFIGERNIKLK